MSYASQGHSKHFGIDWQDWKHSMSIEYLQHFVIQIEKSLIYLILIFNSVLCVCMCVCQRLCDCDSAAPMNPLGDGDDF